MKTVRAALRRHGAGALVFVMDDDRFGQQGTLTHMWARRGSRPAAVKQTRYEWVHLYAARRGGEPATGESVALQAPHVNTGTFNVFLGMLAKELGPREHAILIMDQAGWRVSRGVRMPDNVTGLLLPPYSPELNPIERVRAWRRSHLLSNRAYRDDDHLLDASAEAWRAMTKARLRSICRCDYLTRGEKWCRVSVVIIILRSYGSDIDIIVSFLGDEADGHEGDPGGVES